MTQTPEWVSIVAPFASGAFGIGLGYGIIRAQMTAMKERLIKVEAHIEKQVGEARCREYRDICRTEWKEDIERIERHQDGRLGRADKTA